MAGLHLQGIEKESIPRQSTEATARLFNAVDNNGDGQIEAKEAAEYVAAVLKGDELFDTTEEVDAAVAGMITGLDGSDKGSTISLDEFADHAATLLQVSIPSPAPGALLPQHHPPLLPRSAPSYFRVAPMHTTRTPFTLRPPFTPALLRFPCQKVFALRCLPKFRDPLSIPTPY